MSRSLNTCEECGRLMELDEDHEIRTGYYLVQCECGYQKRIYSYVQLMDGGLLDA